jgi:hypothetical protein
MSASRYTVWQALELAMRLAMRANEEVRLLAGRSTAGPKGDTGEKGDPGPPGQPGTLPLARAWVYGVHYRGDVRTHNGATWQAARDTAEEPPGEDWVCLAEPGTPGRDAAEWTVHGLYDPEHEYRKGDTAAHNGSEWRAKRDNPGPLPGDGWAIAGKMGKRGEPGPRGERGERGYPGLPGDPAPTIVEWATEGYNATPMMSDGSAGPALDMRQFFELYDAEARR